MHRKLASDRKILDGKRTKTKNERNLTDEFKKTNGKLNLIYIWAYWHCSLEQYHLSIRKLMNCSIETDFPQI